MTTTSRPVSSAWCCRNDSRTIRFIRFLAVARRQCFLETARPSLATPCRFARQITVNHLSRLRDRLLNTGANAAAFNRRFSLRKRYRELPGDLRLSAAAMTSALEIPAGLWRQPGAALGPAPFQDQAAGLGRHARPEAVPAGTLDVAGLICAFHRVVPGGVALRQAGFEVGGKGTQMPNLCQ